MFNESLLLTHVVCGVIATILGGAVAFESYLTNRYSNRKLILSVLCPMFMIGALVLGGYWYLLHYPEGKELIKSGPIPWAHGIIMESKEHIFFILICASFILPFAVKDEKRRSNASGGSGIVMALGVVIFVLGLLMEGMGGIISMAIRISMESVS